VSSTRAGADLSASDVREKIVPRLLRARVERLTLTGGEPFVHPDLLQICEEGVGAGLAVGICTNGTGVTDDHITALRKLGRVHVNVSFDGFRAESHGRFRGSPNSFDETVDTARRLGRAGLLQGFLSTPNSFTTPAEYTALTEFAQESGAEYLLMNPLSSFGRGARSRDRLAAGVDSMKAIRSAAETSSAGAVEIVPIRFPNDDAPLGSCIAGEIIYVFVDGAVGVCPYLVFAARTAASRYADTEFIVGNILREEIADALEAYRFHERYTVGANSTCGSCVLTSRCGKGCPAAVVASGGSIGDRDVEPCPVP
jgi:radical SAM protein with 4Fe4S-binding SPASM domain